MELLVLTVVAFIASYLSSAFAVGGNFLLLAVLSYFYPVTVVVQLMPIFVIPSLCARICLFWRDINWPMVKGFVIGTLAGVFLGGQVLLNLDEATVMLLMGSLILTLLWFPDAMVPRALFDSLGSDRSTSQSFSVHQPIFKPFIVIGFGHSFLSTLFAIGAILQSVILRAKLNKAHITGTLAACLITMSSGRILIYGWYGFDYQVFVYHAGFCATASVIGSWYGKRVSKWVSETLFRKVFKYCLSGFGILLLARGLMALIF